MIRIAGNHKLDATSERVWAAIYDPTTLVELIPGCQHIEQVSPEEYQGQMQVGLPAVNGTYDAHIRLMEYDEPRYCRFKGTVLGPTGTIEGEASFKLEEVERQTVIEYEGQAMVTGALAKLSPRFIEGVVNTLINQWMSQLNKLLQ